MRIVGRYRIEAGAGGHFAVRLNDALISDCVELRDKREAEEFIVSDASERGWRVEPATAPSLPMEMHATINPNAVRFTLSSINAMAKSGQEFADIIRRLARDRAAEDGRSVVSAEDAAAVLGEAAEELVRRHSDQKTNG